MHREEKILRRLLTQPYRLLEYLVPERHWPAVLHLMQDGGFEPIRDFCSLTIW
jgi:hypothetical protein